MKNRIKQPTIILKIGWEEALKEMWGKKLAKQKIKIINQAIINKDAIVEDKEGSI